MDTNINLTPTCYNAWVFWGHHGLSKEPLKHLCIVLRWRLFPLAVELREAAVQVAKGVAQINSTLGSES